MKKSEFKEYLKTEILKMTEAEVEVDSAEKAAEVAKELPDAKITVKEFKNYLREEILAEIGNIDPGVEPKSFLRKKPYAAQLEEQDEEIDVEDFDFDEPGFETTGEQDIDDITDSLVDLARKAKNAGQIELANQILNSAKFSSKTQFKDVEKEV